MKKYLVILAGSLLFASTAALADPPHHGPDRHHDNRSHHDDHGRRGHDDRHDNHHGYYVMHDRGRHEGWYRRGGHVPVEYRDSRYVVTDWRVHHLRQPPRGYHWVRSDDNQFLLVAVATGVIADILLSH